MILILNHLYLGDLILILKSSTYDDFAHLCIAELLGLVRPFIPKGNIVKRALLFFL